MSAHVAERSRAIHILLGTLGLTLLLAVTVTSIAAYRGTFKSTVPVMLVSDRAGLMLEPGSDVKMREVVIGRVSTVDLVDGRALIAMDLDADRVPAVPANTTAAIDPTTLFGRKFVSLTQPEFPSSTHINAGAMLAATSVPTEANDLLEALVHVLRTVEPQKVNGALNSLSTALQGRGDHLGETLVELDQYVSRFNGSLPTLQRDLAASAETTGILADAAPDLMHTVENLTTTGQTVTDKSTELSSFILSFTEFGNSGKAFMTAADVPLVESMSTLVPTTALLAERAPTYPCFMSSLAQTNKYLERLVGGSNMPGLNILGTLLMGDPPYTSPVDLPIVAADGPAKCYDWTRPPGHTDFNDGSHPYSPARTPADLIGNPFAQFVPGGGR